MPPDFSMSDPLPPPPPTKSSLYDQKLRANSTSELPQKRRSTTEDARKEKELKEKENLNHSNNTSKDGNNENNTNNTTVTPTTNNTNNTNKESSTDNRIKLTNLSNDLTSCRGIGKRFYMSLIFLFVFHEIICDILLNKTHNLHRLLVVHLSCLRVFCPLSLPL